MLTMARSRWKLTYFSRSIWRKIFALKKNKRIRRRITFDRSSSIPLCFINRVCRIYKGKRGRTLFINFVMIGKKFGEFSFTRKPYHFPSKKSKKKNFLLRR